MTEPAGAGGARARRFAAAALLALSVPANPAGSWAAPVVPSAPVQTPPQAPPQAPERYAVVVNPATPVNDVTLAQLRRIFRGEQQFWSGGARVVLFVQAPGTPDRGVVLKRVYEMDEGAFKRFWIAKTFRDEVASGPKIVSTSALARRLTAQVPGAVSVIPLSAVDEGVRVLRVDGRLPDESGYPIVGGGQ
jgi:phosphate transport system substrate-binding protein